MDALTPRFAHSNAISFYTPLTTSKLHPFFYRFPPYFFLPPLQSSLNHPATTYHSPETPDLENPGLKKVLKHT